MPRSRMPDGLKFISTTAVTWVRNTLVPSTLLVGWLAAGVFGLWLMGSALSPDVAAWAPLRYEPFGRAVLWAEGVAPLALLLVAFLGHVLMPRYAEAPRRFSALALVPFLFCLGYFCSIYRPEALWGLDHDPISNFLGYLPYSDAADYYDAARHFLDVGEFTAFSERRPANVSWLVLRLAVTGSLAEATLLQVVLAGMATAYLGFVACRIFGPWSSIAVVALTYTYSRFFFTTTLSETPGLSFGALGVGLALCGIRTGDGRLLAAGMSALGLGESFRTGAALAPLGFAAGATLLARPGRRLGTASLATFAYVATLLISPGLNAVYGSGTGQAGGNLSFTVAGLSLGGDWGLAQKTYATELARRPNEVDQARFLYAAALRNVREDPWPAIWALMAPLRFFESATPRAARTLAFGSTVFAFLLVHRIWRRLPVPGWPLRIAGPFVAGVLLSLPLIYLADWRRLIAASIPGIFLALSLLLAWPDLPAPESRRLDYIAASCPPVMMVALVLLPGVAQWAAPHPDTSCLPAGKHLVRRPSREPAVLYQPGTASSHKGIPVVTPERVQAQQPFSGIPLVLPDPPVLLDWGYDYSTHRLLTLVAPLEIVDAETEFLWVDTAPLGPAENHRSVVRFGIWAGCGH